jgi:hypothetical protein
LEAISTVEGDEGDEGDEGVLVAGENIIMRKFYVSQ